MRHGTAICRWSAISAQDGATTAPLLEAVEAALASQGFGTSGRTAPADGGAEGSPS